MEINPNNITQGNTIKIIPIIHQSIPKTKTPPTIYGIINGNR